MTMEVLAALPIASALGVAIGKIFDWRISRALSGLAIAAGIGVAIGIPLTEIMIDCAGLALGLLMARR